MGIHKWWLKRPGTDARPHGNGQAETFARWRVAVRQPLAYALEGIRSA